MIGVSAPWVLGVAAVGALATIVLHFLSVRRPPVLLLPTMRFLPDRSVRAVSRSARPSDLLLLLMRVAALLLIGTALSGVTWRGTGVKHGRVVVLQRGALENTEVMRSVVRDAMRGAFSGDTVARLVLVDSTAHVLSAAEAQAFQAETLSTLVPFRLANAVTTPTLTAAFLVGVRAAGALVRDAPAVGAVELIIATPFMRTSLDAGTNEARAMWPGPIRLVDTRGSRAETSTRLVDSLQPARRVVFGANRPTDAVASAFLARGWLAAANSNALPPTTASSLAVPVTVEWPETGVPSGWAPTRPDTVGAVIARGTALVFPFVRTSRIPAGVAKQGRAVAWWSDGQVAAVEVSTAGACTRHVGIRIPPASDVLHGQSARALLLALSGPCGGEMDSATAGATPAWRTLTRTGNFASAIKFRSTATVRTPWAALLLVVALALLVAEWWMRDREDKVKRTANDELNSLRKVA